MQIFICILSNRKLHQCFFTFLINYLYCFWLSILHRHWGNLIPARIFLCIVLWKSDISLFRMLKWASCKSLVLSLHSRSQYNVFVKLVVILYHIGIRHRNNHYSHLNLLSANCVWFWTWKVDKVLGQITP